MTEIPPHVHGTASGYSYWACRCDDCRWSREARARNRAALRGVEHVEAPPPSEARPSWFDSAACKGHTDLFFPPQFEPAAPRMRRVAAAVALCAECPAQHACRTWARRHREVGIWGGETDEERIRAGYRNAAADPNTIRRSRSTG